MRLVYTTYFNSKAMPTTDTNYSCHINIAEPVQPIAWGSYHANSYLQPRGRTQTHTHTHTNMHSDDPHRINFKKLGAFQLVCNWFKNSRTKLSRQQSHHKIYILQHTYTYSMQLPHATQHVFYSEVRNLTYICTYIFTWITV